MLASSTALRSLQPLTGLSNALSRRLETDEDRVHRGGEAYLRWGGPAEGTARITGVILVVPISWLFLLNNHQKTP